MLAPVSKASTDSFNYLPDFIQTNRISGRYFSEEDSSNIVYDCINVLKLYDWSLTLKIKMTVPPFSLFLKERNEYKLIRWILYWMFVASTTQTRVCSSTARFGVIYEGGIS